MQESSSNGPRLYFAYGSNLSLYQMRTRCPTSSYYDLGILPSWRWIISKRGYANIVRVSGDEKEKGGEKEERVWGMLYTLEPADERLLERAEGVPYSYEKEVLDIDLISSADGSKIRQEEKVKALVYVDYKRTAPSTSKEEYIFRMNRGIRDAVAKGMDVSYVEKVMRPFIREEGLPEDENVEDPFLPEAVGGRV
jgi:gamma-glutamylcyclotransferase